ncbi:Melanopsin [Halocaridina rubra]|uniref:Melanopsin n=1 Tax=Halocaridina rubra TaxID=373956 RepID=A0AAN9A0D5_HALRR
MNATEPWLDIVESTISPSQSQSNGTLEILSEDLTRNDANEIPGTSANALISDLMPSDGFWNYSETFVELNNLTWAVELGVPKQWLVHHAHVTVPSELHYVVATILTIIGVLGTAGNAIVLWVFTRFRRLRSPANTFIVNLSASDLITSVLHSMAAYSSFRHQWSFGRIGKNTLLLVLVM